MGGTKTAFLSVTGEIQDEVTFLLRTIGELN